MTVSIVISIFMINNFLFSYFFASYLRLFFLVCIFIKEKMVKVENEICFSWICNMHVLVMYFCICFFLFFILIIFLCSALTLNLLRSINICNVHTSWLRTWYSNINVCPVGEHMQNLNKRKMKYIPNFLWNRWTKKSRKHKIEIKFSSQKNGKEKFLIFYCCKALKSGNLSTLITDSNRASWVFLLFFICL